MLGLFPFAKTFECAKISLVVISWSCLYIPLYNTSWLVVARQLCYFVTAQLRIQLLLPFLDNINVSFFSISHPNAGYTLKTTLFEECVLHWTYLYLRCSLEEIPVLFSFKPKTLPFEDKIKMPLFSLQGYLKTLKSHFGGIPLEKIQCAHGLSFIPRWSPVCHTASF